MVILHWKQAMSCDKCQHQTHLWKYCLVSLTIIFDSHSSKSLSLDANFSCRSFSPARCIVLGSGTPKLTSGFLYSSRSFDLSSHGNLSLSKGACRIPTWSMFSCHCCKNIQGKQKRDKN